MFSFASITTVSSNTRLYSAFNEDQIHYLALINYCHTLRHPKNAQNVGMVNKLNHGLYNLLRDPFKNNGLHSNDEIFISKIGKGNE